jgi:tRNA(Ile2) C34 agmatinyltransferase TiaS
MGREPEEEDWEEVPFYEMDQEHWLSEQKRSINRVRKETGMEPLEEKTRKCLRCNREFLSRGKQNRMCSNCKSADSYTP